MTTQYDDEVVDGLAADFQRRNEAQFQLANTLSTMLAFPGLRGLWSMAAIDSTGRALDYGGLARHLTLNGNPVYNFQGLRPYIDLDGTGDFLSHVDAAGFDIIGTETYVATVAQGLTMGCWTWTDASAAATHVMAKDDAAAQRSYALRLNTLAPSFLVNGATSVTGSAITTGTWNNITVRFNPSTELAIFINGAKTTNVAAIPATLNNSTAPFHIGADSAGGNLLNGRVSMAFLSTMALDDTIVLNWYEQTRILFRG